MSEGSSIHNMSDQLKTINASDVDAHLEDLQMVKNNSNNSTEWAAFWSNGKKKNVQKREKPLTIEETKRRMIVKKQRLYFQMLLGENTCPSDKLFKDPDVCVKQNGRFLCQIEDNHKRKLAEERKRKC